MKRIYFCRYCRKQVLKRKQSFHVHCQREARRPREVHAGDIQEPKTAWEQEQYDALIAERVDEIKCNGGVVAFIVSRTPKDDSPAAEIALRTTGIASDDYLELASFRGARSSR